MKGFTMWTLLVLCSVLTTHALPAADDKKSEDIPLKKPDDSAKDVVLDPKAVPCGGYLNGTEGVFYSPNFPHEYPNNQYCVWYINPNSSRIQLNISVEGIEQSSHCRYDYVAVCDGSSTGSPLLDRFCKRGHFSFQSTGHYFTVAFRSDSSATGQGFRAEYRIFESCKNNCGSYLGSCSCHSNCGYWGECCLDYEESCLASPTTTDPALPRCANDCGWNLGSCSCERSCYANGNCCPGYHEQCSGMTYPPPTSAPARPSCRYNCGNHLGSCSCASSCERYGNCCNDYYYYCPPTTDPYPTTAQPSCRYNCGHHLGSCSCASSCQRYGNCCYDYYYRCPNTTAPPYPTTARPSCRYNCGNHLGSCSCASSCQRYGNCCYDYYYRCPTTTAPPYPTTARPSCRYNCGYHLGSCSCASSCERYGNCCYDYYYRCPATSAPPYPTTARPSCRYNCGYHLGSCSCASSCQRYGNCCYDYYYRCPHTPDPPYPTTARPSCRYNCGYHLGSCSCASSCQRYGNCCYDYYYRCPNTTAPPYPTTAQPSCRYNCGNHLGSCSCASSCQRYGNCCYDYYYRCPTPEPTTAWPSCRYNCGRDLGSCSCYSSCRYNGSCCHDYYEQCSATTPSTGAPCGGSLFGSGMLFSPNYPGYYHDNAYCVWNIRAAYGQRLHLAFKYLQMENCCGCDYISVYDGPSTDYPYLGKVCGNNLASFYSTSTFLTVVFWSDGSVVGRGFTAEFMSSLQLSSGRVNCTSEKMEIVMQKTYLDSLGYTAYNLTLNDPYCRPRVDRSQVVFSFPIGSCGNERQFVDDRVVYTNVLRAYGNIYGEITRQSHLKLNISCIMDKNSVSHNMYVVQHPGNSSIIGTGRFNTSMTFYSSSSFYYPIRQIPYEVELNENLYVQVNLIGGDSSMVLFLDTCVASPSPFDFQTRPYYLVRNGCAVDNTYYSYTSGYNRYARFRVRAFQFLRATESVFLQCKVLICRQSDYSSRCRRGCMRRKARDLGSKHDSQTLVLGPIKLKDPKKEEGSDEQNKA